MKKKKAKRKTTAWPTTAPATTTILPSCWESRAPKPTMKMRNPAEETSAREAAKTEVRKRRLKKLLKPKAPPRPTPRRPPKLPPLPPKLLLLLLPKLRKEAIERKAAEEAIEETITKEAESGRIEAIKEEKRGSKEEATGEVRELAGIRMEEEEAMEVADSTTTTTITESQDLEERIISEVEGTSGKR